MTTGQLDISLVMNGSAWWYSTVTYMHVVLNLSDRRQFLPLTLVTVRKSFMKRITRNCAMNSGLLNY